MVVTWFRGREVLVYTFTMVCPILMPNQSAHLDMAYCPSLPLPRPIQKGLPIDKHKTYMFS